MTRRVQAIVGLILVGVGMALLLGLVTVSAQTPAPAVPTLSDAHKVAALTVLQTMTQAQRDYAQAQLAAIAAQTAFDTATQSLRDLQDAWHVDGFTLDLAASLTYTPAPEAAK